VSNIVLSLSYFILRLSGDSTHIKDDNRTADIASPNLTSVDVLGGGGVGGVFKRLSVPSQHLNCRDAL
jgi:hypothetical protein